MLESVDSKLLNGPVIVDSFGNSSEPEKFTRFQQLKKVFGELGLSEDSPEW